MKTSFAFIFVALVGVGEALYHAYLEKAFTTNYSAVSFAPYAAFYGVPYWVFGVVWFPVVLVVGLWTTRFGGADLKRRVLLLLSVGNIFTIYLWHLDADVVRSFAASNVGLYVTNYALTGLVVAQNWSGADMKDFTAGTVIGMAIGVFFGPVGVAGFGVFGGLFGALSGYTSIQ